VHDATFKHRPIPPPQSPAIGAHSTVRYRHIVCTLVLLICLLHFEISYRIFFMKKFLYMTQNVFINLLTTFPSTSYTGYISLSLELMALVGR